MNIKSLQNNFQTLMKILVLWQRVIEAMFDPFLIILERQCLYQLTDGKYWLPTYLIKYLSENVHATNKTSKSDFVILYLF